MDPGNTELLAQKQKLLSQAVNETKEKLQTLKTAAEQANQALANGDITQEQYDALQREIIETENALKDLERQAEQSATALQKIAAVGDKMKTVGNKIAGVGQDLTTKVTLPLVAAGTVAVNKFADVDKTMQLVNKTMQNSDEEAAMLSKAMKEAAMNSVFGMTDAAQAALNFARAGLDAKEASAALAPAMALAAGEGGNLEGVSAGLVGAINGFGDSFNNTSHYADVFANACNNSALDVDTLAHAVGVAVPVFNTAGYAIEDVTLYMGIMADKNIDADKAANSLKTGLARLVAPAKEGADAMEALGISVTDASGHMKDTITIQRELHDAFAGLSEAEQIAAASAIFGKNQMAPWLALINTAPEEVEELNGKLRETGTAMEMSNSMMQGFGGAMERLKSVIDVAVTSLG